MDFEFSEEQRAIQDTFARFCDERIAPKDIIGSKDIGDFKIFRSFTIANTDSKDGDVLLSRVITNSQWVVLLRMLSVANQDDARNRVAGAGLQR